MAARAVCHAERAAAAADAGAVHNAAVGLRELLDPAAYVHGLWTDPEAPPTIEVQCPAGRVANLDGIDVGRSESYSGAIRYGWVTAADDRLGVPPGTRVNVDLDLGERVFQVYTSAVRPGDPQWNFDGNTRLAYRSLAFIEHPEFRPFRWPGTW